MPKAISIELGFHSLFSNKIQKYDGRIDFPRLLSISAVQCFTLKLKILIEIERQSSWSIWKLFVEFPNVRIPWCLENIYFHEWEKFFSRNKRLAEKLFLRFAMVEHKLRTVSLVSWNDVRDIVEGRKIFDS